MNSKMTAFEDLEAKWRSNRPDWPGLMLCFYTGKVVPDFCAPMPRVPTPPVGTVFDETFVEHYRSAIDLNPAIHDGAVLIGREQIFDRYMICGWSMRLYPPPGNSTPAPNRGSAFNSCLEMSDVGSVDRLYLLSAGQFIRFIAGAWITIE
ncbi:MAG: hypothetical protein JWR00_329 [Rubritepida sp.]|nr:hypothetical protein [Rubritepida sp.]